MKIVDTHRAEILTRLRAARRNYLLRGAASVGLGTALVLAGGLAAERLLDASVPLRTDSSFAPWLAAGVTCVLTGAFIFGRIPTIAELGRRADREFGLGERLSAFLSAPKQADGPAGAILLHLAQDAAAHSAQVKPARLEPLATPTLGLLAGALALMLAAGILAPGADMPPAQVAALDAPASLDIDQRRENLDMIAEVLREDSERRQEPYLATVAEAVRELARTADANLAAPQFNKQLEGLLDHARIAYGKNTPAWLRGNGAAEDRYDLAKDRNVAELARMAEGSKPVLLPNGGGGEELIPELFTEHDAMRNASVAPMKPGEIRTSGDPDGLKIQQPNIAREGQNGSAGEAKQVAAGGSPPSLGEKEDAGPIDLTGATAVLAGAATQSGAGASRVAGQGTQDLNDPNQPAAPDIAQGPEQVLLPPDQYRQGKRIRMQMNPHTENADGADDAAPGFANARRGEPAPVSRDAPTLRDQDMFARVFVHDGAGGR